MASYKYSIKATFNDNLNFSQLHREINKSSISQKLLGIHIKNDTVTIEFDNILGRDDLTELESVINNHTPSDFVPTPNTITSTPRKELIKWNSYRRMSTIVFPGSTYAEFKAHSYMEPGSTSYSLKIYDITNRKLILESTQTNISEDIVNLGTGSNIPRDTSIFEISSKVSGRGRAFLESVTINYS